MIITAISLPWGRVETVEGKPSPKQAIAAARVRASCHRTYAERHIRTAEAIEGAADSDFTITVGPAPLYWGKTKVLQEGLPKG